MATITIHEAEAILETVKAAVQDTSHHHHPVSSLKGHDLYQVNLALKLRVANEYLHLAHRSDCDEKFAEVIKLYDSLLWLLMDFVADDQVDNRMAESAFMDVSKMRIRDERFASDEKATSFGEYCKSVGFEDRAYWRKIYLRLDLDYTSDCPRGNQAVMVPYFEGRTEPSPGEQRGNVDR